MIWGIGSLPAGPIKAKPSIPFSHYLLYSFLVLGFLLASCATGEEQMAGYVGQHKSELINNWGPPTEEKKLKNGGSRLEYLRKGIYHGFPRHY